MCAQQGLRTLEPRSNTACPPYVAGVGAVNANEMSTSLFMGSRNPIQTTMMFRLAPLVTTGRGNTTPGWSGALAGRRKFHNTAHSAGREACPFGPSAPRLCPGRPTPQPTRDGCAPRTASACEVQILGSGRETKRIGRRSQCRGRLISLRIADHPKYHFHSSFQRRRRLQPFRKKIKLQAQK